MERVETLLRLLLTPGVGAITIDRLLAHFGSSDAVLGAKEAELRAVEGLHANQVQALRRAAEIDPRPELELAARQGVDILPRGDPRYPPQLLHMADPPPLLYVRGELAPTDALSVAMVGTRRASRYGREQAERFGGLLARAGYCVISGLAWGIDTCAHRGCLDARGRTIAVLGCGLSKMYPEENRDLATEIAASGAVVSELPMETGPSRDSFPRRNRIVAGLALGVLVVEAPARSGALITARHANEMGREVFAIPGRIDQSNAEGCHRLIRDGATLVRNLEDILQELGPPPEAGGTIQGDLFSEASADDGDGHESEGEEAAAPPPAPSGPEAKLLAALGEEPVHIDQLCAATGLPVQEVAGALMLLEIQRKVKQQPGKFFVKA